MENPTHIRVARIKTFFLTGSDISKRPEPSHIFTNTKFSNCFLLNLLLYVKLFKLLMCQNLFIKKNILFINAGLGKDPVPVSPDLAKKVRILMQKVLVVLWI